MWWFKKKNEAQGINIKFPSWTACVNAIEALDSGLPTCGEPEAVALIDEIINQLPVWTQTIVLKERFRREEAESKASGKRADERAAIAEKKRLEADDKKLACRGGYFHRVDFKEMLVCLDEERLQVTMMSGHQVIREFDNLDDLHLVAGFVEELKAAGELKGGHSNWRGYQPTQSKVEAKPPCDE